MSVIDDSWYEDPPQNEMCKVCGEWIDECICEEYDEELFQEENRAGLI